MTAISLFKTYGVYHPAYTLPFVKAMCRSDLMPNFELTTVSRLTTPTAISTRIYRLRTQYPEEPENLFFGDGTLYIGVSEPFKISTPDATLSLPDDFLFRTHFRLAGALHMFSIEDKVSKGWPRPQRSRISQWIRNLSYRLSRYIPLCIRLRFYLFLRPIGRYLYTISLRPAPPLRPGTQRVRQGSERTQRPPPSRDRHQHSHASYFMHSDFHATNLMVEGGRLAAIINWECAGYKPEYWGFTKAMYGSNWKPIQQVIFWRASGREYEKELAAERTLWRLTPFGA